MINENRKVIKVNGQVMAIETGKTVAELLRQEGYDLSRIAVERNGRILARVHYTATRIRAEDTYEIVSFVGGG